MNRNWTLQKISLRGLRRVLACGFILALLLVNDAFAQQYIVKTWGRAQYGRLGIPGLTAGDLVTSPEDLYIDTGWGGRFVHVAAGEEFSIGIKENGSLWAWGRNNAYQLGRADISTSTDVMTPIVVDSGKNGKWWKVSASLMHCIALKEDSSLWVWGSNGSMQLANNATTTPLPVPTQILPGEKFIDVTTWGVAIVFIGTTHIHGCAAIRADKTLFVWGANNNSTFGDGGATSAHTPKPVVDLAGDTVKALMASAGIQGHIMVIRDDSTLWGWGWNTRGQVGNGSSGGVVNRPTQVSTSKWTYVSAGHTHSLGIQADGSLWAWGGGTFYQLGDGTTTDKTAPTKIDDGTNGKWVRAYAGYDFGMAVREDGTIWTWGNNLDGVLGDGTSATSRSTHYQIPDRFVTMEGMSFSTRNKHVLASGYWYYPCEKPQVRITALGKSVDSDY
jgi:alpha-tubulin suppressor-like RCC1 family protein